MKRAEREERFQAEAAAQVSEVRKSSKCLGKRSEFSAAIAENLKWKVVLGEVGEAISHEEPHTLSS